MYTTGELAGKCGVSVRTVQYYDSRNILVPSQLSEGGRRLYSEADLHRLEIICFLRELDLPIHAIGEILSEKEPGEIIDLLLSQQEEKLRREAAETQQRLQKLLALRRSLQSLEHPTVESIGDAACQMKNQEKLKKVRLVLLSTAIPFGIMEWTAIFLWIFQGIWWPFALYGLAAVPYVAWIFGFYWHRVSYICPGCHRVFKPGKRELFFAGHTPTTRKLTCPGCGRKGYCVETYGEE